MPFIIFSRIFWRIAIRYSFSIGCVTNVTTLRSGCDAYKAGCVLIAWRSGVQLHDRLLEYQKNLLANVFAKTLRLVPNASILGITISRRNWDDCTLLPMQHWKNHYVSSQTRVVRTFLIIRTNKYLRLGR